MGVYYQNPDPHIWQGRRSNSKLYFHENIVCRSLEEEQWPQDKQNSICLLGYQCDAGVKRNQGRIGAVQGPNAIRKMLAPLANHLAKDISIFDVGNMVCEHDELEKMQEKTAQTLQYLVENKTFPIVLGGGHDLAYAHFSGLKRCYPEHKIGIVNLDAHFDLRAVIDTPNSGTPFYQIAQEQNGIEYLCLGIQRASNNKELYDKAEELQVTYIEHTDYNMQNKEKVIDTINLFVGKVDCIYLTVDLDGFTSAIAPGVSAPSPCGFNVDIAYETIKTLIESKKLLSVDVVELNPTFDIDNSTARLAARLIYEIVSHPKLFEKT